MWLDDTLHELVCYKYTPAFNHLILSFSLLLSLFYTLSLYPSYLFFIWHHTLLCYFLLKTDAVEFRRKETPTQDAVKSNIGLLSRVLLELRACVKLCVRSRRWCVKDVCVTKVNGGGRVLTAGDRFQGREVTIGVNRCLPKEQITIHIKTHPQPALIQPLLCLCQVVF